MKKLILAGLLALPVVAFAGSEAKAFFTICGQHCCTYRVCGPRVYCGFDWGGCQTCPAPAAAPATAGMPMAPWFAQYPGHAPAAPVAPAAQPQLPQSSIQPVAPTMVPAAYQTAGAPGYYGYGAGNFAAPSYWYAR